MTGYDNLARRAYETEPRRPEAPKIRHKRNPKPKKLAILKVVKPLTGTILAFALAMGMIYGKVELSRITNEQSELKSELAQLQENNLSLESELESKTSIVKVEEYAENVLGLIKLDKSQIEYIEIENKNKIEVDEEKDESFIESVKKWFDGVLEYIGI